MLLGDLSFLYKFFRKYSFILALPETAVNGCCLCFKEKHHQKNSFSSLENEFFFSSILH